MKKMKFTFGLMLSMLILGANVANAQFYDNSLPHSGRLGFSATVRACDFYSKVVTPAVTFNASGLSVGFHPVVRSINWGSGIPTEMPLPTVTTTPPYTPFDYYFDKVAKVYKANPVYFNLEKYLLTGDEASSIESSSGNIFHSLAAGLAIANTIEVSLDYFKGNELQPQVKRYITLGRWLTMSAGDKYVNVMIPSDVVLESVIDNDGVVSYHDFFAPHMDRKTDVATYTFIDDLVPLLNKHIIYSVHYEIGVYDQIDDLPGKTAYPPVEVLPTDSRRILIETADGITTNPSTLGSALFVPSKKDFEFIAYSKNEITEATIKLYQPSAPGEELLRKGGPGIKVKDNKDGSYTVTVKQVDNEMLIKVASVISTNSGEEVGNAAIAADNVWSAFGTLYVQAASPATLSIYSVTGQLVQQVAVSGSYSATLPKGLYIVQLNGKAYKIIN